MNQHRHTGAVVTNVYNMEKYRMKRVVLFSLILGVAAVFGIGCDWTSGGGVESWNARWNWVNFSGVYRNPGGYLVSDFSSAGTINETVGNTSGGAGGGEPEGAASRVESFAHDPNVPSATQDLRYTPIVPGSVSVSTSGDISFTDDGDSNLTGNPRGTGSIVYDSGRLTLNFQGPAVTQYTVSYIQQAPGAPGVQGFASSGRVSRTPVVRGSLTLSVGETFVLRDNGDGGLAGSGVTGTIDYDTGAWSIDYGTSVVPPNTAITASYRTQGGTGKGGSGSSVHTFNVVQEGEQLSITDNNGAVYSGNLGSVRGTGGFSGDGVPPIGETIIAQFRATGVSSGGMEVEIAGNFQGVVGDAGDGQFLLATRQIMGTWVESGGVTGDVRGESSAVRVDITDPTTEIISPDEQAVSPDLMPPAEE